MNMENPIAGKSECNMLHLGEGATQAANGEEVSIPVIGKVVEQDGMKMLQVTSAGGVPVQAMKEEVIDEDGEDMDEDIEPSPEKMGMLRNKMKEAIKTEN
jgi:hypothetical protein